MLSFFSQVRLSVPTWPWDSSDKNTGKKKKKNTGVGCHTLLQRFFPTQGSNPHPLWLHLYRVILYGWATGEALIWAQLMVNSISNPSPFSREWGVGLKIPHFLPWLDLSSDQPSSRSHAGARLQLAHYSKNTLLTQEVIKVSRVLYQDLGSETYIYIFFYHLHL